MLGLSPMPPWAEVWHLWKVIVPRRSITGQLLTGQVWRRHDGPRAVEGLRLGLDSNHVQTVTLLQSEGPAPGTTRQWEVTTSRPKAPADPIAVLDLDGGFLRFSDGRWARRPA